MLFQLTVRKTRQLLTLINKKRLLQSGTRKWYSFDEYRLGMDMSSDQVYRGAFVVLEGCDRCGKTTQCKLLVENLNKRGIRTELVQFPDRSTPVGALISSYLQNKENLDDHTIHLLFSANRWELKDKIVGLLQKGVSVIADRYSYSGVAFSAAKQSMNLDWCRQPETGLPSPDLVVFLELSSREVARRGQFGEERYEIPEFQKRVKKVYEHLKDEKWVTLDADKSIDDLQQELLLVVQKTIASCGRGHIKRLWEP